MSNVQTQLTEARLALHEIITGNKAVSLERAGRKVTFNTTNKQELQQYISELESQANPNRGRRAMRVTYSV